MRTIDAPAARGAAGPRPPRDDVLVGREAEIRWLSAALGAAARGGATLVAVEGAAGTGRSRIVREARERGREAGATVVATRALRGERDVPLATCARLAEALAGRLGDGDVRGQLAAAARGDAAVALTSALAAALASLAHEGPVVVAIDDADCADAASLQVIAGLALRLDDLGGVVLLLVREPAAPGCADGASLDAAFGDPAAVRIRLGALTRAQVAAVVAAHTAAPATDAFAGALFELTAGNPSLVHEALLAAAEHGLTPDAAGAQPLQGLRLPAVARAIRARVAHLDAGADALLDALAVLGHDATLARGARLAGVELPVAAELCGALLAAGVLSGEDPPRFARALQRSALHESIAPAARMRAHAGAARVLAADGVEPRAVAAHLLAAAPAGDAWVADWLSEAARAARERGDLTVARLLLRRALDEGVAAVRPVVTRDLARVGAALGDPGTVGLYEQALAHAPSPAERAALGLGLTRALAAAGDDDRALRASAEALAHVAGPDDELRACLAAERAALAGEPDDTLDALAPPGAEPTRGVRLLWAARAERLARGGASASAAEDLARRALAGGTLLGESDSLVPLRATHALALAGCAAEAVSLCDAAVRRAELCGLSWARDARLAYRGAARLAAGDVAGAVVDGRHAVASRLLAGPPRAIATATLVDALREQGDLDGAAELAGTVTTGAVSRELAGARARLHLAQGHGDAALHELADAAAARGGQDEDAAWLADAALGHLALGDRARAGALAGRALAAARAFGADPLTGRALLAVAQTAAGRERERLAGEAAALLTTSGAPLDAARALVTLGRARHEAGRTDAARTALREAMDVAHRCGATALEADARAALVAAGGRPRRALQHGPEGLTRSERRVAELAARGQTNREIAAALVVTPDTVATHLRAVYRKLAIGSRAELPAALGARR